MLDSAEHEIEKYEKHKLHIRKSFGKDPQIKKVWSLTIEGGGSPRTEFLFRFAISFNFLMCTAIHPIYGEIIYWGSCG